MKNWIYFQKRKWKIQREVKENNSNDKEATDECGDGKPVNKKAKTSTCKVGVSKRSNNDTQMDEDSDEHEGQEDVNKNKTKIRRMEPMSKYEQLREERIQQINREAKALGINNLKKELKKTKLP